MAAAAIFLGFLVQHMLDAGEVLSGVFEHVSACEKGECAGGWGGGRLEGSGGCCGAAWWG